MSTITNLNDQVEYVFAPEYAAAGEPQRINLIIAGMDRAIGTDFVAIDLECAENTCDALNARLGFDRLAWMALAGRILPAHNPITDDDIVH